MIKLLTLFYRFSASPVIAQLFNYHLFFLIGTCFNVSLPHQQRMTQMIRLIDA